MTIVKSYINGNTRVTLHSDGTKIREWDGEAKPDYPESIDLKITDKCDAGCAYCHERSTVRGKHADSATIQRLLAGLPAGTELAIGGGDPFEHPELHPMLEWCQVYGLVPNITVNGLHVKRNKSTIEMLRRKELIYGLGVSYNPDYSPEIETVMDDNTVIHVIAGVHSVYDVMKFDPSVKILVLGYKNYGRGITYQQNRPVDLHSWRYWIGRLMTKRHVSFDSLALEQLQIQSWLKPEVWAERYMGADGKFTMYVDAVTDMFAVSSTKERMPCNGRSIPELFKGLA